MRIFLILALFILVVCATRCIGAQSIQTVRWRDASIEPRHEHEARMIVSRIMQNKARYDSVAGKTGVPYFVIAGLHNMESGGSFRAHLHEGSSLNGRTRFIPKGRPLKGNPPFTWEFSAIDALEYDRLPAVNWSSLSAMLYAVEAYNGTGYLRFHPKVPSPYLYAGTTIEVPGKYTSDGKWSPTARSSQLGIAVIWKQMEIMRILDLTRLKS